MGKSRSTTVVVAEKTNEPRLNKMQCERHRMVMDSSEILFQSRFEYGEPIGMVVVFKCHCCNETNTVTFKD